MGSVQVGECDVMGHMNVRHYVSRALEALAWLGLELGLGPGYAREHGAALVPADQHMCRWAPGVLWMRYGARHHRHRFHVASGLTCAVLERQQQSPAVGLLMESSASRPSRPAPCLAGC